MSLPWCEQISEMLQDPWPVALHESVSEPLTVQSLQFKPLLWWVQYDIHSIAMSETAVSTVEFLRHW